MEEWPFSWFVAFGAAITEDIGFLETKKELPTLIRGTIDTEVILECTKNVLGKTASCEKRIALRKMACIGCVPCFFVWSKKWMDWDPRPEPRCCVIGLPRQTRILLRCQ